MRQYYFAFLLCVLISGCNNEPYNYKTPSGDYIVAEGGNMLWYNQPSSVFFSNKYSRTYLAWTDSANRVNVAWYDDERQVFSDITTVHKWGYMDDHGQPVVHVKEYGAGKGHIHLLFAQHNSPLLSTISGQPEQIEDFGPLQVIDPADCGYPSIIENEQGSLAIFYNRNVYDVPELWTRPLYFRTSDDGGKSWSKETELINHGPGTWIYYVAPDYRDGTLHIAYSVKESGKDRVKDIYYVKSHDWGKTWTANEGIPYQLPMRQTDPMFASPANYETRAWDIAADTAGKVHIAYVVYNADSGLAKVAQVYHGETKQYNVAYSRLAYYPAGIVIDEKDPNTVYAGRSNKNNIAIAEIKFNPGENKYVFMKEISADTTRSQVRPQIVKNYRSLKLLWVDVIDYTNFQKYKTNIKGYFLRPQ